MTPKIFAPSPNFNERDTELDTIILHYTDMRTTEEALTWLRAPVSQVSCHYLISAKGEIYALVSEDKRAWHAGESFWKGRENLNSSSLGIELANPGHSFGYTSFPPPQMQALLTLLTEILARWSIAPSRILGHSDIAPRRKQDPGHLFPWYSLYKEGFGLWPAVSRGLSSNLGEDLEKIGYETVSLPATLLAFQRHFQPHKLDGIPDEETLRLLRGLSTS